MRKVLAEYFPNTSGTGVLSSANARGEVNSAVYARPHVLENDRIAFIMRERLTWANLQENPHAAYLFREDGEGYQGVRLHLTRVEVTEDPAAINALQRVRYGDDGDVRRLLVTFRVDRQLPLTGAATGAERKGLEIRA